MGEVHLLLASRNAKKLAEMRRLVSRLVSVEVIGLGDVPEYDEVPESGATFADNALIKAREAFAHTGLLSVADDSGLAVDALNGMPGVLSARWSGPLDQVMHPSREDHDVANLNLVLAQLADVPDERLGAAFVCAMALVGPAGEQVVEGRMPGRLIRAPRGANGFGYDPIFVPSASSVPGRQDRTSAELEPAEKDAISHRGQALRALAPLIAAALEH